MARIRLQPATTEQIVGASAGRVRSPATFEGGRAVEGGLRCPTIFSGEGAFGHIDLGSPVIHPMARHLVAELLGLTAGELEGVVLGQRGYDPDARRWRPASNRRFGNVLYGGVAVEAALGRVEAKAAVALLRTWGLGPQDLLLRALPVPPPGLRDGGIDRLYRPIVEVARRINMLLELDAPQFILQSNARSLQFGVEQLFFNRKMPEPLVDAVAEPLRSLVDRVDDCRDDDDALVLALRACAVAVTIEESGGEESDVEESGA